jgi:hypothetical protein
LEVAEAVGRLWGVIIREMGAESDFTTAIKPIEKAAGVVEPRAVTRQSKGKRARRRGHCARHHRELPDPAVFSLARSDPDAQNWIVYIASLSKIVSPGLRVGLAVLPSRLIAPFTIAEQASSRLVYRE